MPKIFELFGFPLQIQTDEAIACRKSATCPFMGGECDGGGNRYASQIDLKTNENLQVFFENRKYVASGVCSIQLKDYEAPWIVCPRRLLVLGNEKATNRANQTNTENQLLKLMDYPIGTKLGVWSEVKLMIAETSDDGDKSFHYTFDYVIMAIGKVSEVEIVQLLGGNWSSWRKLLEKVGYSIVRQDKLDFVENFPMGVPYIVEIMTSSTSGGNKLNRTTIPQAFEDAILGKPHQAPNINKRQVWARMVSQLIVKSEVAMNWGGKALWLIQDNLADYITASTALNLKKFKSETLSEVNLLSFSYVDASLNPTGVIELELRNLFSGPISANAKDAKPSFSDMIRTPLLPPIQNLIRRLVESKPINQLEIKK
jgi:Restriction endonuclease NotI